MEFKSCSDEICCYIWYDPETKFLPQVTSAIKESGLYTADYPILQLSANANPELATSSLLGFVLQVCRKSKLLQNDLTSFLCSKDHQLAMQLCAANISKKDKGEFSIDSNDITKYFSTYMNAHLKDSNHPIAEEFCILQEYLEFLKLSNSIDEWQLLSHFRKVLDSNDPTLMKFLRGHIIFINGIPSNPLSMKILELIVANRKLYRIHVELPLDASFHESLGRTTINVNTEQISLKDIAIAKPVLFAVSASEDYVKEISLAFLRLLVNCRDEMALARALISPIMEMSHAAFTDLKRLSIEKGMPMCQTAISYITRLRLGGKSYAPPKDCPLHQHTKGLSLFVDFLQQLQTILEDEACPMSCFKQIVKTIKSKLLRRNYLRRESIEKAAEDIIQLAKAFHSKYKEFEWNNVNVNEIAENKISSLQKTKFLCWIVDYLSTQYLFADIYNMLVSNDPGTPLNLPTIFSYFKSPIEIGGMEKTNETIPTTTEVTPSSKPLSNRIFDIEPTETTINNLPEVQVHTPVLQSRKCKQQWNAENPSNQESVIKKPKRCIFGNLSNIPSKTVDKKKKPVKSKKVKELPKGQTKLNQFFLQR